MSTIRGDIANLYPVRQGQLKAAPFSRPRSRRHC